MLIRQAPLALVDDDLELEFRNEVRERSLPNRGRHSSVVRVPTADGQSRGMEGLVES